MLCEPGMLSQPTRLTHPMGIFSAVLAGSFSNGRHWSFGGHGRHEYTGTIPWTDRRKACLLCGQLLSPAEGNMGMGSAWRKEEEEDRLGCGDCFSLLHGLLDMGRSYSRASVPGSPACHCLPCPGLYMAVGAGRRGVAQAIVAVVVLQGRRRATTPLLSLPRQEKGHGLYPRRQGGGQADFSMPSDRLETYGVA